jgi:hypothetical protein
MMHKAYSGACFSRYMEVGAVTINILIAGSLLVLLHQGDLANVKGHVSVFVVRALVLCVARIVPKAKGRRECR